MQDKRANSLIKTLEKEIVTGELTPGERLEEISLARRFGVSRTPVREALNQLSSIGLVQIRLHRGAVVAAIGIKEMAEMFEVMAELEGTCGWLAARRMDKEDHVKLRACHERARSFVENEDHEEYYETNRAFHNCIYVGSRNKFLANQTRSLSNRLAPFRRIQLSRHQRLSESFCEHRRILEAIIRGDDERSRDLLRQHVTIQSASFTDFLATIPSNMVRFSA